MGKHSREDDELRTQTVQDLDADPSVAVDAPQTVQEDDDEDNDNGAIPTARDRVRLAREQATRNKKYYKSRRICNIA